MPYCLPPLNQTYVEHSGNDTILMWRKNDGETGWVSTVRGNVQHKDAFRRHTSAVRRFMWLQRAWRIGKHFEWSRVRIQRAFYV
jgi:hypothetical protein